MSVFVTIKFNYNHFQIGLVLMALYVRGAAVDISHVFNMTPNLSIKEKVTFPWNEVIQTIRHTGDDVS